MPLFVLPPETIVMLNFFLWLLIHLTAGYVGARLPSSLFTHDTGIFRTRHWENQGRWYQKVLKIKHWKKRIPDAGRAYGQNASKKKLESINIDYLKKFALETRRAEWTHWIQILPAPIFFLFNEWYIGIFMIVYAFTVNLPCIITQRYNRPRLLSVVQKKESRII